MKVQAADKEKRDGKLTVSVRRPARLVSGLLLLVSLFSGPGFLASTRGHRVSDEVRDKSRQARPEELLPVIVQTIGEPSNSHLSRARGKGAGIKTRHQSINGYSALVPAGQIEALANDPDVDEISYDSPVHSLMDVAVKAVHADLPPAGPGGLDGTGIGIALIDTGVQGHQDLMHAYGAPQLLEVEIVGHERGLADYFGHGTHVAGILGGSGLMSSGSESFRTFRGLAPGAQLISLRALQPDGSGSTSDVIKAIDWVMSNRQRLNIRVLNLSLGHPVFESYLTDPLCRAVRNAVQAGIVVVTAAGNGGRVGSGFGTILSPANEPSVVTVGAMDDNGTVAREDDVLAPYSAKGPSLVDAIVKPDLVAPGSFIVSLRAVGSFIDVEHHETVLKIGQYRTDGRRYSDGAYLSLSGTSLAAPIVAGAAALMLQQDPRLTPADVKTRLMVTASKDDRMPFETGAGYLDVAAALASKAHAASALSPRAVPGPDGGIVLVPLDSGWNGSWDQGLVWGGGRAAATLALTENDMVTASGLVWGGGASRLSGLDAMIDNQGLVWGGGR